MSVQHVRGQEALDLAREFEVCFCFGDGPKRFVHSIEEVDSFGRPMIQVNFMDITIGNDGRLWYDWDRFIRLEVVA